MLTQILQKMLNQNLTFQILKQTDRCLKEKKSNWTNRAKTYSYLKENNDEDKKKAKDTKKCVIKRKIKFQNNKNCVNEARMGGKAKYLEKNKFNVDNLKEFLKNNLILKMQQRFKNERHNVFTEVINKIVLCSNDDKRMQSIDSTETYAYGTSKDITFAKEKIKRHNKIQK